MTAPEPRLRRPGGVTALSLFFAAGAVISLVAGLSLLFPAGALEGLWRLNPQARQALGSLDGWAVPLFAAVSVACALSAWGLWFGLRWGHRLALAVLCVNLLGDTLNATLGSDRRAAIGLPLAGAMVLYLLGRRRRQYFARPAADVREPPR
jgi:hypothetical protein